MDLPKEATEETGVGGGGGKKKKQKKSKPNKTQSLNAFLADTAPGKFVKDPPKRTDSWADAMEERLDAEGEVSTTWQGGGSSGGSSGVDMSQLPSAPRKAQARNIDMSRLPKAPPYTVYLGNLSYECSEEDIVYFFERKNLKVREVRLPTDSGTSRLKGFGYAELDSVGALLEALELTGENLRNRAVTIDLATSKSSDGYGDSARGERYRSDSDDRTDTDWRKGSGDDRFSPQREYQDGPSSYHGDRLSYRGGGRGGGYDEGRGRRGRGSGGWNERPEYRDNRGYSESRYGDRDGGRRHDDYYDRRGPPRHYDDGGYNRGTPQREERPRLQLQPRTKPVETTSSDSRSSIFGSAQPVDTAAREREIEDKLKREQEKTALDEERVQKEREAREEREKVSVFGGARPVDTASREKEIEEKLRRQNEELAERTKRQRKGSDEGRVRRGSDRERKGSDRVRKGSDRGWPSDDGGHSRYSQSPDGRKDEETSGNKEPQDDQRRPQEDQPIDRGRPNDNLEQERSHDRGRRKGLSGVDNEGRRRNRVDSNESESGREWRGGGRRGRGGGGGGNRPRGDKMKGHDSDWSKGKSSKEDGLVKKYEEPPQPTFSQPSRYAMLDVEGDDAVVSGGTRELTKPADD